MPTALQNFIDRMRQMQFRGRTPPVYPDPTASAEDTVEVPVATDDYSRYLYQPVWLPPRDERGNRISDDGTPDWHNPAPSPELRQALAQMSPEEVRARHLYDAETRTIDWAEVEIVTMANNPTLDIAALEHARRQIMSMRSHRGSGIDATWIDEDVVWRHEDGLFELPGYTAVRGVKEAGVRFKGFETTVLPVISLQEGRVEYSKGAPEPENGKPRDEFEAFAMKEIIKWSQGKTKLKAQEPPF